MQRARMMLSGLLAMIALAGCGGGRRLPPGSFPPPPAASVAVAITSPAIQQDIAQGDRIVATVAGTWTASNLGGAPVYLQLGDTANAFVLPATALAPAGGRFSYALPVSTAVVAGEHAGTLTVRACRDAACAQPYANASASVGYRLRVASVAEWETAQRNAAHDGYVPITLDPTRFAMAWTWVPPVSASGAFWIDPVVTSAGQVHVMAETRVEALLFFRHDLHALGEADATTRWSVQVAGYDADNGRGTTAGEPAIAFDRVHAQVRWSRGFFCLPPPCPTEDPESALRGYAVADGAPATVIPWPHTVGTAPVVGAGDALYAQGQAGLRAYDRNGGLAWEFAATAQTSPAVDAVHVYHDSVEGLQVLDRATGALLASVADPMPASGAIRPLFPMLGGRGNVIAFVGEAVYSPTLQWGPRRLASFDIATRSWRWTSPVHYQGIPAVANGVVYATRNGPMALDAIDEATGAVLWSWTPSDPADTAFATDNIVATRNLLFVGTDRHTYALDLATRQPAWRIAATGALAISAGRTLYIANTTAGLTAVRLQ